MKKTGFDIQERIISKYLDKDIKTSNSKKSNINDLLNRIELNKKSESRKKLYFSAAASTGLILFGLIIF
mgnify:CR=1 FL=1|tara:strand:+ start:220 stop:426 length:207 start_codon:yes stop_codon:yes gene_type:complete